MLIFSLMRGTPLIITPEEEGMPSRVLADLIRNRKPKDQAWAEMVEERRVLIRPFLDRFTLEKLKEVKLLRENRFQCHAIGIDNPRTDAESGLSLETQGIWQSDLEGWIGNPPRYKKWGLSRAGDWILVTIFIAYSADYERAERVDIRHVEFTELLRAGKSAFWIWCALASKVHEWVHNHAQLQQSIAALDIQFKEEQRILEWLS
jgi:hypothetical protein